MYVFLLLVGLPLRARKRRSLYKQGPISYPVSAQLTKQPALSDVPSSKLTSNLEGAQVSILIPEDANISTLLTGVPGVCGAEARRGGGDVEADKEEDPRRE